MDNAVPAAADMPDTISSAPTVPKKQISRPRALAVLASEDEIEEELGGLMDTDDLSNMNGLTEYDGDFDRFSEPRWKSWGAKGGKASAARVPTLQADSAEEPATSRYGGNNSSTSLGLPPLVGEAGIARQASDQRKRFFNDPGNQKLVKLLRYAPRAYTSAGPDRQKAMLKTVLNTGWDDLPGALVYANAGLPDSFYRDIGPKAYIATLRRLMIENDAGEVLRLMGRSTK